eukprot:2642457-Lingulodinium_polyedra.AAC.1
MAKRGIDIYGHGSHANCKTDAAECIQQSNANCATTTRNKQCVLLNVDVAPNGIACAVFSMHANSRMEHESNVIPLPPTNVHAYMG